jgi:predicted metal-dependent HD superfamily phosphohydrolase
MRLHDDWIMTAALRLPGYVTLSDGHLYACVPRRTTLAEHDADVALVELARWRHLSVQESVEAIQQKAGSALARPGLDGTTELWLALLGERLLRKIAGGAYQKELESAARDLEIGASDASTKERLEFSYWRVSGQAYRWVLDTKPAGRRARVLNDVLDDEGQSTACHSLWWLNIVLGLDGLPVRWEPESMHAWYGPHGGYHAGAAERREARCVISSIYGAIYRPQALARIPDQSVSMADHSLSGLVRRVFASWLE